MATPANPIPDVTWSIILPEPTFRVKELQRFARDALQAAGCSSEEAMLVASTLADADLRGLHSHGVLRLPVYVASLQAGGIVADAPMNWIEQDGATALLDAGYGFGQRAMSLGTQRAAELASAYGCSQVGIRRSSHFGTGEQWVRRLTDRGLAGIVVSNTGPSVAPFASADPILGTNPISIGLPSTGDPLVLDMATSQAAYGKIVAAKGAGESIPDTWAMDDEGRPTTDPNAALGGALRPFGDHKGSGLAVIVEALAAAMTGARLSQEITDMWFDPAANMGTGHLIVALRPFGTGEHTKQRVSELVEGIESSTVAQGHDQVLAPGTFERLRAAIGSREGVVLPAGLANRLQVLAAELGIEPPG